MARAKIRPTFEEPLSVAPQVFFAELEKALATTDGRCRGRLFRDYAILRIRQEERELWSPALNLEVDEEAGVVRGVFAPSSPVWTAFLAIYVALLCIGIAAGCYGWSQWTLGETPWALAGVPVVLVLAGLTYGAAFIGQGLGAEDMHELRSFVERTVESAEGRSA